MPGRPARPVRARPTPLSRGRTGPSGGALPVPHAASERVNSRRGPAVGPRSRAGTCPYTPRHGRSRGPRRVPGAKAPGPGSTAVRLLLRVTPPSRRRAERAAVPNVVRVPGTHDCRIGLPTPGGSPPARPEADPVRRRRAQLDRQGLGRLRRPLGAHVPRRLRGGAAQPGRHDPLRGAQRAGGRPRRAHLQRVAGPGGADARARRAPVHGGRPPAGEGVRRVRALLLHRARLHQHADRARTGRHPAGVPRPHRGPPGRAGRRPRRVQPRADRGLHRLRGDR